MTVVSLHSLHALLFLHLFFPSIWRHGFPWNPAASMHAVMLHEPEYFIQSGLDELSPRCLEMLVCTQIQRLPQPSRCVHSNAPVPHEHITEHMTLYTGQVWNEALAKWLRTQLNPQGKTRQKGEANREAELCLDSPPGTAVYRRGSACSQTWWALQGIAGFTTQIQFPEFCQTACPDT